MKNEIGLRCWEIIMILCDTCTGKVGINEIWLGRNTIPTYSLYDRSKRANYFSPLSA